MDEALIRYFIDLKMADSSYVIPKGKAESEPIKMRNAKAL